MTVAPRSRRKGKRRLRGPGRWIQVLRRTIQLTVLLGIFAIPSFSLYENLRNQHDDARIAARWDTRLIRDAVRASPAVETVVKGVRGSVWTFKAGDLVVSDPLAVLDFAAASRVVIDVFFLTALIPLLLTLLFGRVFCGWICPADLLFEAASKVREWAGVERDVRFWRGTKYGVLLIGLGAGVSLGSQVFAEIYPPRIMSGEIYEWITFGFLGAGTWFLLVVVAFEIFVSKRFWCRYVCPGGALYSFLGRWRVLRLKLQEQKCSGCTLCEKVCAFDLDPMSGRFGPECNNCGACVRSCAPNALTWRLSLPPADGLDILDRPRAAAIAAEQERSR